MIFLLHKPAAKMLWLLASTVLYQLACSLPKALTSFPGSHSLQLDTKNITIPPSLALPFMPYVFRLTSPPSRLDSSLLLILKSASTLTMSNLQSHLLKGWPNIDEWVLLRPHQYCYLTFTQYSRIGDRTQTAEALDLFQYEIHYLTTHPFRHGRKCIPSFSFSVFVTLSSL